MPVTALTQFGEFVSSAAVPPAARAAARDAVLDTVGVTLAGSVEPVARMVRDVARAEGGATRCGILGVAERTGAGWAALANGTAAHALDFDDMCFVSLAHPSAPLVAAGLAAAELADAGGAALLDAYCVGFEIEAVLGRVMNPTHYAQGWHATATLGTIGAAATAVRLLGQDAQTAACSMAIAASEASGLKESFGTMVKPLQAGLAGRNGVLAALLAEAGLVASERAVDGPQGLLVAMQARRHELGDAGAALGRVWEIVDGGITVKLYPSCAATHPTIDTLIDLRAEHGFGADEVDQIEIGVDAVTPTVLIHDRPTGGLEAKFSMHFCAAAAVADGRVDIQTFETGLADPRIRRLLPRVTMRVDPSVGGDQPALTEAVVTVRLVDGQSFRRRVRGARGYPSRPPTAEELDRKFRTCAERAVSPAAASEALEFLRDLERRPRVAALTDLLAQQVPV
ncbi:MAG: MmgE/PrpD family protein [Acidobacteria bacterium]|nr:MmgE/PrpD family protein [Acidobacteriota bacterium]